MNMEAKRINNTPVYSIQNVVYGLSSDESIMLTTMNED